MIKKKKDVLNALSESLGIVSTACKMVNVGRTTFYKWIKEDEDFRKRVEEITEEQMDFGESQLLSLVTDKNPAAVIFYNKCKNKKRGYVENELEIKK